MATTSPGAIGQPPVDLDRPRGDHRARAVRAHRLVERVEDLDRRRRSLGARVVALAQPAQRQVGLRREHEHEQAGLEPQRARRAAATRSPPRPAPSRPSPATRAPARTGTRPAAWPARARDSSALTVAIASACAFARPKTLSVGSPATTSRKCPPSRRRLCTCASMRSRVPAPDERHEQRDQRQREERRSRPRPSRARAGPRPPARARSPRAPPAAGSARSSRRARRSRAWPASSSAPGACAAPGAVARANSAARSSDFTRTEPRPATVSLSQASAARASTTASSAASAVRERSGPAISPASSQAWAIVGSAVAVPRTMAAASAARAERARRQSLRSSATRATLERPAPVALRPMRVMRTHLRGDR